MLLNFKWYAALYWGSIQFGNYFINIWLPVDIFTNIVGKLSHQTFNDLIFKEKNINNTSHSEDVVADSFFSLSKSLTLQLVSLTIWFFSTVSTILSQMATFVLPVLSFKCISWKARSLPPTGLVVDARTCNALNAN